MSGGQIDCCGGLGRYAFLTARETQALGRGGLHTDGIQRQSQDVRDALAHGLTVLFDPGALADQGHIHVDNLAPSRDDQIAGMGQEPV